MNEFENFLKENNYKGDLEFHLCDLELAFDSGKKLQWKPSVQQIAAIEYIIKGYESTTIHLYDGAAKQLYLLLEQLKQL